MGWGWCQASAETYDCDLLLDVNCELWRVKAGEKVVLTLATSLTGEVDDGTYKPTAEASLLDMVSLRAPRCWRCARCS